LTVNAISTIEDGSSVEADTFTITVVHNNTATSMACSVVSTSTTPATLASCSNTSTFPVSQGDRISLQYADSLNDGNSGYIFAGTTLVCY
jgi:hypothetical protein